MNQTTSQLTKLTQKLSQYESRIHYLETLLQEAGIPFELANQPDSIPINSNQMNSTQTQADRILQEPITKNHARFFYSMFKGRNDVYSKRAGKPNNKTGKTGYYTQCWNFWKDGICPKKTGKQVKCAECSNQSYKNLTGEDIVNHLVGERKDCLCIPIQ